MSKSSRPLSLPCDPAPFIWSCRSSSCLHSRVMVLQPDLGAAASSCSHALTPLRDSCGSWISSTPPADAALPSSETVQTSSMHSASPCFRSARRHMERPTLMPRACLNAPELRRTRPRLCGAGLVLLHRPATSIPPFLLTVPYKAIFVFLDPQLLPIWIPARSFP